MPRPRCIELPGIPQHVAQRGNYRQPRFLAKADYLRYRTTLREIPLREACAVNAYVLTTDYCSRRSSPMPWRAPCSARKAVCPVLVEAGIMNHRADMAASPAN